VTVDDVELLEEEDVEHGLRAGVEEKAMNGKRLENRRTEKRGKSNAPDPDTKVARRFRVGCTDTEEN
jgi:hypothetical protein